MNLDHPWVSVTVDCNNTSCHMIWYSGSRFPPVEKLEAVHATAHTTTLFVSEKATKASLILPKMCIVIGSLVQEDHFPCCSLILLIPAWTRLSRGRDECSHGSGSPIEMWAFRTVVRYALVPVLSLLSKMQGLI